jgi:diguanylate cyclase (GGDEF)-like protein/PAS domain S-box-containing protein
VNSKLQTSPQSKISGAYEDKAAVFATSLLENANDLVAAIDADLRVIGLNAPFRREFELVFGRPVELGECLDDALGDLTGERNKAAALCRRALAGESFRVIEEFGDQQLLRKTYEIALSPILDTHGQALMAAIVMRDMTLQRLAERRFGALLEAAPDAMIIVRADGVIDLANAQAERMFQYERQQLIGRPVEMLLPERLRSSHIGHRRRFIDEARARPMGSGRTDLLGLRSDATEFPVEISLNPLDVGAEKMVVAAIRDMTIRQRAEDRLRDLSAKLERRVFNRTAALEQANNEYRESEARFRMLADNIDQLAWMADDTGSIFWFNKRWFEYTGAAPEQVLGWGWQKVPHPDHIKRVMEKFKHCIKAGIVWEDTFPLRRHNGQYRWFLSRAIPIRNEAGRVQQWFGTNTDITEQRQVEDALRESKAQLGATFDQAAVGIVHISVPERRILQVNQTFCRIVGYEPDELLALTVSDLTHPEDAQAYEEQYDRLIAGQISSFTMEKRYIRKDGAVIWVRKTFSAVRNEHGAPLYGISIVEDITDAKQADLARQETANRLQLAVTIANLGFWELDVTTNEFYFSAQWKNQLGYQDHELSGGTQEWQSRLHRQDRDRVQTYLAAYIAKPTSDFHLEYRLRHRDRSYRWMKASAIAVTKRDADVVKLIGTQLDVTETKVSEQRVLDAAQHDPLTGLPNRALVFEYANHVLAAAGRNPIRGAFMFIDLDRFKPINDLYGHGVGDRILQEVGKRLEDCVRDEDLVGRLGGDEFVIMLPYVSGHRASTVAQHVLDVIARPFQIDTQVHYISASIGISHFPQHSINMDVLIHYADLAMYQAKQGGGSGFHLYTSLLSDRADAASIIEAELRRAIKSGGLELHYQPVVDMRTRHVVGVEALLRLAGDDVQAIGPEQFIPIAESAGLIGELGEWVVAEACRQHARWRNQGLPSIAIAVNVSSLQFRGRGFAQRLQDTIKDTSMDPACFQIELTESAVMDSMDEAIDTMRVIKAMGIKIALDDFGTGYSSLSHLSQLPLDKLKVDQSFVQHLEDDRTSRAITVAIIALGRTLNLEVVGEGIESESALDYLQENGCDQAQGFIISQPLPADDFANWFRDRTSRGA